MDPIISVLNEAVQKGINIPGQSIPAPAIGQDSPSFQATFDNKITERLLNRLTENEGAHQPNEVTVLSAENIHIETANLESGQKGPTGSEKFYDMFAEMNKDLLSLDTALEVLTTPGTKISPRQLLSLQAGIANTSIMAEGFSKFTDGMARAFQTTLQMQT